MQPVSIDDYFEAHRERILSEWFELLRMPTVGTDPARLGDCARCTAWLRRYLKRLGFDAEVCLTPGQPVLLAERAGAPDAPTVLFYGHYDVQPADPLDLWHSPPFEPTLRGDRVYARGAQDNKGQLFAFLQGVRAQIEAGVRLPTLRLLLEGEEESGSRGLAAVLPAWRRRLQADLLMVCDTEMHASGRPAIVAGLRGMAHLTVELHGPARDLHSGTHGGLAPNPALALARLLATLHAPDGRIQVEGFLDRLRPPSPLERDLANAIPFDEAAYLAATGVAPVGGQAGVAAWERVGFQPTIEVNGLHGGYGGPGSKTVIPSVAMAKLSARLCPDQDARACLELIVAHLRHHCPPAFRLEIPESLASGGSLRLPVDSPLCRLATQVLTEMDPRGPVFVWDGASLPIVATLREVTGAAPILVGFGQEADQIHAPDESYSLAQFRMTMLYAGRMLRTLAGT